MGACGDDGLLCDQKYINAIKIVLQSIQETDGFPLQEHIMRFGVAYSFEMLLHDTRTCDAWVQLPAFNANALLA